MTVGMDAKPFARALKFEMLHANADRSHAIM